MNLRSACILTGVIAISMVPSVAAPPVLTVPEASVVPRFVKVGKTLVIPVAGSDADGDALSYSVESSKSRISARVRTGNPHYKMTVHTDDDGSVTGTPTPFTGDMEFQLFSHATPETAGLIAGVAQSGYYDDVLIHRVIQEFVIQGGDKAGTGSGTSPFIIPHEFRPELIYTGFGQLAMANSQGGYSQAFPFNGNPRYSTGRFRPTNGTQFFVTLGQPRHLDFKHTLFGQIVRGTDTLDRVAAVKVAGADRPVTNVKMTAHSVFASKTDAVILISATAIGPAEITVTAEDANGEKTSLAIPLNAITDTVNNPPILYPIDPIVVKAGRPPAIFPRSVDLESDAITTRFPVRDNATSDVIYANASGDNLVTTGRPSAGAWDLTLGVAAVNDPLLDDSPEDIMRFQSVEIGVDDRPLISAPMTISAVAGVSTGQVTLATFRHGAFHSTTADYVANVNWGDGSAIQASTGANPPITIVRSSQRPGLYEVRGTHTYARPGKYPLIVTIDAPNGATAIPKGHVIVHDPAATIRPEGRDIAHVGARITNNRMLAKFTDSTPGTRASDYTALIDWGDGTRKPGVVVQSTRGAFSVYGSHRYLDAERYSVAVHIRRNAGGEERVAWSSVALRGFSGPAYLPPFEKANVTSVWSEPPTKIYRGSATDIVGTLFILNGGAKSTGKWKLKFWLSNDNTLETATDRQLKFGPLNRLQSDLNLNPLAPGGGGNLGLKKSGPSDLTIRLPAGERGTGKYVIAQLDYSDPITDALPVPKAIPFGPLNGILVSTQSVTVKEGVVNNPERIASFNVRLDTRPDADVTVPLELVNHLGVVDNSRATLNTAQLVFTPQNWTNGLTVTVTAGDDLIKNSSSAHTIRLKPATSTDDRFDDMDAADVALTIRDNIPEIIVTPTSLTIKEGDMNEPLRSATFKVRLGATPTAPVTIPIRIVTIAGAVDNSRATLDTPSLVINDNLEHTVTVTVIDDTDVNGTVAFTIRLDAATSTDTRFSGQNPRDVGLTVQDNDTNP